MLLCGRFWKASLKYHKSSHNLICASGWSNVSVLIMQLRWLHKFALENTISHSMHCGLCKYSVFFRYKWNQNEHRHHSISFSSTWWRIMMIIRKASIIISTRSCVAQTFTSLQINKAHSREKQFTPTLQAVHTTPFLYLTIDSPQTMYKRMMKCGIHSCG